MGDFNLHIHDDTSAISEFNNCLCAMGLEQHVHFPTQVFGQSLDLVITEVANGVELVSCEPGPFLSDHRVVKVVTKVKKENIISKSIIYRNFKDIDRSEFASDITNIKIESESVTEYVELFESEMKVIVDKHAPEIEKQLFVEIRSHGLLRV
jgi:formyltetrahydrofolate synthetase